MSTKEKRDRLFKGGRPVIRELNIYQDGQISKDVGILWVAYQKGSLIRFPHGMNQNEFFAFVSNLAAESQLWLADDSNRQYNGFGPIAVINVESDGWNIEPHALFFPWATARNKLRSTVAFLQMVRYKKIGACIIYCLLDAKPLFDKMGEYGVLHYVGRIPNAAPEGDKYVYSVRGTKHGR